MQQLLERRQVPLYLLAIGAGILLGALLVLLAPCIDYVVVFTALARGAHERLLAATPLLMLAQVLALPMLALLPERRG